uniref:YgjV family protein n=1 Tax=Enterobacter sp. JH569 TaxID=2923092 RepID=UPI00208DF560
LFCLTGIKMRVLLFAGSCLWLANNIIVGSIGGVLLEASVIVINLTTIYRLHKQRFMDPEFTQ